MPSFERHVAHIEIAVLTACAVVLGQVRFVELPSGGSVTLASAPLVLVACMHGCRAALGAGILSGALHALTGGTIIHPAQALLDYGAAYAVFALVAVGAARSVATTRFMIVVAGAAQLMITSLSGVLFFAEFLPAQGLLLGSLAYNATYIVPETMLVCAVVPVVLRGYQRVACAPVAAAGTYGAPLPRPPAASGAISPRPTMQRAITQHMFTAPIRLALAAHTPSRAQQPSAKHKPKTQVAPVAPRAPAFQVRRPSVRWTIS